MKWLTVVGKIAQVSGVIYRKTEVLAKDLVEKSAPKIDEAKKVIIDNFKAGKAEVK